MMEVSWEEFNERCAEIEEKIEKMVEAMQILSKWVDIQQGMNDDETRIFDSLNERILALEVCSSVSKVIV